MALLNVDRKKSIKTNQMMYKSKYFYLILRRLKNKNVFNIHNFKTKHYDNQ